MDVLDKLHNYNDANQENMGQIIQNLSPLDNATNRPGVSATLRQPR